MPKPTLIQSLLNRPSRSYSMGRRRANEKDTSRRIHSVRNDMARIAASEGSSSRATDYTPSSSAPAVPAPAPCLADEAKAQHGDSDEQEEELFFTPNGSPRESCYDDERTETDIKHMGAPLAQQQQSLTPMPTLQGSMGAKERVTAGSEPNSADAGRRHTLPHASSSASSSPSSDTQSVVDASSVDGSYSPSVSEVSWPTSFSASAPSASTRATTPATSENGDTQSSSSRSGSTRNRRKKEEHRKTMYTNDDWAKDVRWLVSPQSPSDNKYPTSLSRSPASMASTASPKRTRARTTFDLDPATMLQAKLSNIPSTLGAPPRRSATSSQSTTTSRRAMGRRRMSAVWEEDEGDDPSSSPPPRRVHTDPVSLVSLSRSHSLNSKRSRPERARSPTSVLSGETGSVGSSAGSSAFTSASRTVDIPVPLPVTDGGTPSGFTSLILPRAAYSPSNKRYSIRFGGGSHVDITRSGLAQTTMSTVSITKNASSPLVGLRPRFFSLTSLSLGSETKLKSSKTPSHLLSSLPSPLSFTSHTPPPSKVNSHQILVQVYAVALDGLDDRIVNERSARKDCYGFVPGRAFVGRAVEVGFEVNRVAKSDWVIGLLDVRKCGALAEFVIVEKRMVTRCPRPSTSLPLEQLALISLCGVPAHRAVRTCGIDADSDSNSTKARALVLHGHDGVGALAVQALAAAGMHVTAHIPMHADASRIRTSSTSTSFSDASEESDKKEDDEPGRSTTRDAEERVRRWGARGVRVGDAVEVVENCASASFDVVIDTVGGKRIWDACQRVLASSGQFTTLVGDASPSPSPSPPLSSASSSPNPSSSSSNTSISSHSRSQSSSTPAATSAIPSINAHFRANLRSLRRTFAARKSIGYVLVSPASDVDLYGEDVRDSLEVALQRASSGSFTPYVGSDFDEDGFSEKAKGKGRVRERVLPFERAPELFGTGVLSDGRTGVVRIVD